MDNIENKVKKEEDKVGFIRKEEYNEGEDENLNKNKVKKEAIIKGEERED